MNKIAEKALSFLGQREISGNKGFINPDFDALMRKYGFMTGDAWCLHFVRMVWRECGERTTLISPSAVGTMRLASSNGNWHTKPIVGSVAIFRSFKDGKPLSTGHGAIVTEVRADGYTTCDGNTNDKGGREGIMVALRHRHLTPEHWTRRDGLRLMGFVYPKNV